MKGRDAVFDPLAYPYPSRRRPVYARHGMVATSQPLAAQAGLTVLQQGGNAVDAAVATAAALTVVEPTSNGIGSDAFAIVWAEGSLHGLNSSGPAPAALSLDVLARGGIHEMPARGFIPVTVPGAPAAWATLVRRFGRLSLRQVLAPAIQLAEEGYPVSPTVGRDWARAFQVFRETLAGPEYEAWFQTFAPGGRPPAIGEVWRSPDHAQTLQDIAETEAESFYRGRLAEALDAFSRQYGGYLRASDLADYQPEWVTPLQVSYRGFDVHELPPNGQGLVALMALNMLAQASPDRLADPDAVDTYHLAIEALKLAFADGLAYIADPRRAPVPVDALLDARYAQARLATIGATALWPAAGDPYAGGTVYLCAADEHGTMVSYIQSNYMGFGSGLVVPGTGIALQNRGHNFSLDPHHPNRLEPGKRPYHTIIPGFLTKEGQPVGPFGVMGGFMQPQGHLQVLVHLLDHGWNPQAALDAPRWQWRSGRTVEVEANFPAAIVEGLAARGHDIRVVAERGGFGRGEIIWRLPSGVLVGATEPRADGHVAAW
jgi:gamma-glutamyltranspeptidase/glutathione hydrolase